MTRASASPAQPVYFVNWWLDGAVIGGLSLVACVALSLLGPSGINPATTKLVAVLAMFVNYPHFSATNYRLYQRRENIRQFPVTAIAMPILMMCFVAAALWQPDLIAPYLIALYLIWSPYHYSGQTVGITMIYARRSGFHIGRWERLALSTFVFSTFVLVLIHRQPNTSKEFYGIPLLSIPFPTWFEIAVTGAMCIAAAVFIGFAVRWCLRRRQILPAIVFVPAIAQFTWFIVAGRSNLFYELVPMFHCLQYLYIAWTVQVGVTLGSEGAVRSWRSIGGVTLRWGVANYVGGILLFIALPAVLFWVNVPILVVTGIAIAGVNIHHFFVDGVIWKLRDAPANSPLMINIPNLATATATPALAAAA
jgi:hypothetical protein